MDKIGIALGVFFLVVQLGSFLYALRIKTKKGIGVALAGAVTVIAVNTGILVCYNQLPGKEEAPGLTYLGKTVLSMGLTGTGVLLLIISLAVFLFRKK